MEEIRGLYDDVSFSLCCKQMARPDIYLHNVMSNFTISMVKTLDYRRLELPEGQQRLLYRGSVIEDNKGLVYYNVDTTSKILIVRHLHGGARTRATVLLNNSHDLDAVCCENYYYTSFYNSDTSEEKPHTSEEDINIEE